MELFDRDLMYEFHASELSQTDALKLYADHAVKEIKSLYGWETGVQLAIAPIAKDKKLFSVSMKLTGLGEPIVVAKEGKQILSTLCKVRKAVMRRIRRQSEIKVTRRHRIHEERKTYQ